MKSEASPQISVVDALSAGLNMTGRRPWLLIIPVVVDLWLWLAPRISPEPLMRQLLETWESLMRATYTPAQFALVAEPLTALRDAVTQAGAQANLTEMISGGWLAAPSVLSVSQVTRMTFISDLVLAPGGLGLRLPQFVASPWLQPTIEVTSVGSLLAYAAGFWLIGQVLVTAYLYWAARSWRAENRWGGWRGFGRLWLRLVALSIGLGILLACLRLPLAFSLALLVLSSNSFLGFLALLVGGVALWLTLWLLTGLFLACESILLGDQPFLRGLAQSAVLVYKNFGRTVWMAGLINLLLYGFRVIWDLLGQTPAGTAVAIVGNAYLGTSMLVAMFVFYENMRKVMLEKQAPARVAR